MPSQAEKYGAIARSAAVVGGATLASRILGLVRDMVLAGVLGTTIPADAFFAAFRIPNFLRRMFAEGSLTAAFIPVFTEANANEGREEAFKLANLTFNWLIVTLVCLSAAGILLAPKLVGLLTPGWKAFPEKFGLTVRLTRVMFPYILLVSLSALSMGILNSLGHFATPALAPAMLNVSLIACAVWASSALPQPAFGIAAGVLLGGVVQILIQTPPIWRRGFRYRWCLSPHNPKLRSVARLFFPSLLGSAVYQVNMIVITVLASLLPHGSLSYLYYADRLFQFPLGVFAIAIGTVALPAMSRDAAKQDLNALGETLGFTFRQVSMIMIPSAVGLIVLREPLMSVLFQRGRFDPLATQMSAQALLCYSIGLWFVAEIRVVVPAFYALKDTLTPMKVAVFSIAVNILLAMALMGPLHHAGLALAVSVASILQLAALLWRLGPKLGGIAWNRLLLGLHKVALASSAMGAICWLISRQTDWTGPTPFVEKLGVLTLSIASGAVSYGFALRILGVGEIQTLAASLMGRLRAKGVDGSSTV